MRLASESYRTARLAQTEEESPPILVLPAWSFYTSKPSIEIVPPHDSESVDHYKSSYGIFIAVCFDCLTFLRNIEEIGIS